MNDIGTHTSGRGAAVTAALLACLALGFAGAVFTAPAHGEAFGELGKVGEFGTGPGKFHVPSGLAVDPSDNSVYVVDANGPSDGNYRGTHPEFRIQKFDSALAPVAEVTLQTPPGKEGERWVAGIAVDPTRKRLYVLVGERSQVSAYKEGMASEILVYSTQEETVSGVKTLPVAEGPDILDGVLHKFASPPPPPPAANTIRQPVGMAFDPKTGGLLILGSEESQHALIDSVSAEGVVSTVYDDTESKLGKIGEEPTSLAVGPDGSVYVTVLRNSVTRQTEVHGVVKLSPPDFTTVTQVHQEARGGEEAPALDGGRGDGQSIAYGPQVAVNPEGTTVYAMQESNEEHPEATAASSKAGSYEVRGMSTTTGAQEDLYGGGATECLIASQYNAIAAGGEGVVYVLDEGNIVKEKATSYGYHLIEFGPGGGHCPAPVASIAIDVNGVRNTKSDETFRTKKGYAVEFGAELHSELLETPTKVVWGAEGPEAQAFKAEATGNPAVLTTSHRFLTPGLYTVALNMTVSPATLGSPAPVTRRIDVETEPPKAHFEPDSAEPKPGEAVTFNAEDSSDPLGKCSAQAGCEATNKTLSYTWNFGDGSSEVTTRESSVAHAFANTAPAAAPDTVTLTVTDEEGLESTPTTQTLTIQGTPTGSGNPPPPPPPNSPISPVSPNTPVTPVVPGKPRPLTNAQKLALALKACRKDRSKKARAKCERGARAKYGPKPKKKAKKR